MDTTNPNFEYVCPYLHFDSTGSMLCAYKDAAIEAAKELTRYSVSIHTIISPPDLCPADARREDEYRICYITK